MIILWYISGSGWAWRTPHASSLLEDSAGWDFLERMVRGRGDRTTYPTHTREALKTELLELGLDLTLVVLRVEGEDDITLDLGQ